MLLYCCESGCQEEEMGEYHGTTPTIRDNLHWLLVRQSVDFKICLLVYRCLHQLAAPYLVSMITPVLAVSTRRHLRSAFQGATDKNSWFWDLVHEAFQSLVR